MPRCLMLALLLTPWFAAPLQAQDVLIYRCLAADGSLTVRDSPCDEGERQDLRSMVRPQDPPPRPAPPPPAPGGAAAQAPRPELQVVFRTPPRPMYECSTSNGETYVSDNDEGNPRWVPVWTLGYPTWTGRHARPTPTRPSTPGPNPGVRPPGPTPPRPARPGHGGHPSHPVAVAGGTWVRDRCHPLPQQEICSRMNDRRWEILRRYNSANQTERRELDLEKRGIDARIENDCGGVR